MYLSGRIGIDAISDKEIPYGMCFSIMLFTILTFFVFTTIDNYLIEYASGENEDGFLKTMAQNLLIGLMVCLVPAGLIGLVYRLLLIREISSDFAINKQIPK